jgi:hypothetical protein
MTEVEQLLSGQASLALIPLLGLAVDVAAQLAQSRLPRPAGHVRKQFISFGVGGAATAVVLLKALFSLSLGPLDLAGYFLLGMLTYAFLGFCFVNVINLNVSSMRIRMIMEIRRQHPNPVPVSALIERYGMAEVLDARLLRLQSGRQIERRGDRLYLRRGAVLHIAHFFSGLRVLLFGRSA